MLLSAMTKKLLLLILLVLVSIGMVYLTPDLFSSAFLVAMLVAYFFSDDEPFWLAYFLILADGFFGFFGLNEAMLTAIPGLPAVEVGQFYIILSVVKALRIKRSEPVFFGGFLVAMAVYIVFLIAQGYTIGLSMALNVQFRLLKLIFPFLLFFSLPRLLDKRAQYEQLFTYLFPVMFFAFGAQIFTIVTSISPGQFFNVTDRYDFGKEIDKYNTYRGLFNPFLILLTYFGALFFSTLKEKTFNQGYLTLVILCNFFSVFLSATRGWVIGLSFILVLYYGYVAKLSVRMVFGLLVAGMILGVSVLTIPLVKLQVENAFERILTLEKLAEGDLSAGGTLSRIDERAPIVMKKWRESPLTGVGFSNTYFQYGDGHVGNHNVLLHSGIIGALLLAGFLIFFHFKLFALHLRLWSDNPYKQTPLVFIIFFCGWFIIHSSSGQQFGFHQGLAGGMIQAVFFMFGAQVYRDALNWDASPDSEEEAEEAPVPDEMAVSH